MPNLTEEEMLDAERFARTSQKRLLRLLAQAQAADDVFDSPESRAQFRVMLRAACLAKLPQAEIDAACEEGSSAAKLVRQGAPDDARIQVLDGPEGSEKALRGEARAYISRFAAEHRSSFDQRYYASRRLFYTIIATETDVATRNKWCDAWRAANAVLDGNNEATK